MTNERLLEYLALGEVERMYDQYSKKQRIEFQEKYDVDKLREKYLQYQAMFLEDYKLDM